MKPTEPAPAAEAPCFVDSGAQAVTVYEGSDITLSPQLAPTGGAPTAISWTRGDQELVGGRYRLSENNNTVLLNLHQVTREDGGLYTVVAKNQAGETRANIRLRVDQAPADLPVFLRRLSDLAVKVGTRTRFLVEIRCPSELKVSWHHEDTPVSEGERFQMVQEGNFHCVDVAPVMVHDGGTWTCLAASPTGRSSCSCQLSVLVPKAYKSPEFVEDLRALLSEQGTVSLECKVVGVPTPVLRWYKDGTEIKAGDMFALTADPGDPTSLGTYTCEAVNCMGSARSSSRVHVVGKGSTEETLLPADSMRPAGPAPVYVQELSNQKVKIGDTVTLACQVAVPPWPLSIAWYNKEGRVEPSDKYHVLEDGLGGYMLEMTPCEAVDEGEWKCVATSALGVRSVTCCELSVSYPKTYRKPRFLESLKAILTEEGLVSFECKVVGFPTPQLRWFKDGQELRPGDVYQLTGTNSLGSYSCIARNCMGEAMSSADLTVEDIQSQLNEEERLQLFSHSKPPKIVSGLKSCEARINDDFCFTVQVSVVPEPQVAWYRDDELVLDNERYTSSKEVLGTYNLHIQPLEIVDQAEWKCVASNEFGHSVTSCYLKLSIPKHFKKPRFLECLRAILSDEGAVNLECKVIGVPQPVLRWYKDGRELQPGDIHRIVSGQDGTCCLGTYTCEAHNCMGTASSSASLLGFEERMLQEGGGEALSKIAAGGHALARNPSLSTIHEERTSQMPDTTTDHSATLDERAELSFSFDGKEVSVSLYETPDLTEEEALQVVEMYADQLSEHVSEDNVVELPPLRFVKETSNSGKLLMEAVVIDVSPEYFTTAEDDLRTDVDLEELSNSEENGQSLYVISPDIEDDGMPISNVQIDNSGHSLPSSSPYRRKGEQSPPVRPPRKKASGRDVDKSCQDSETFHSLSPDKGESEKQFVNEDKSEFLDEPSILLSDSPIREETYASAKETLERPSEINDLVKAAKIKETTTQDENLMLSIEAMENNRPQATCLHESAGFQDQSKIKQNENVENLNSQQKQKTKSRSPDNDAAMTNKDINSESENIGLTKGKGLVPHTDISMHEGEVILTESIKIDASASTDFAQKSHSSDSKESSVEKDHSFSEEGDGLKTIIKKKNKVKKKGKISPDTSSSAGKKTKRKGTKNIRELQDDTTKTGSKNEQDLEKLKCSEKEDLENDMKQNVKKQTTVSSKESELPKLSTSKLDNDDQIRESSKIGDDSALLQSLTRSLQDIQQGLVYVEPQVLAQSITEQDLAKSSVLALKEQTPPIQERLALSTQAKPNESFSGKSSPAVLENVPKEFEGFQNSTELVEEKCICDGQESSLLENANFSKLDHISQPIQEIQSDVTILKQQETMQESLNVDFKDLSELKIKGKFSNEKLELYLLDSVRNPIFELHKTISMLKEQSVSESKVGIKAERPGTVILAALTQPLNELERGISLAEQQSLIEAAESLHANAVGTKILTCVLQPFQEFKRCMSIVEQQAAVEEGAFPPLMTKFLIVKMLEDPVFQLYCNINTIPHQISEESSPVFRAEPYRDVSPVKDLLSFALHEIDNEKMILESINLLSTKHAKLKCDDNAMVTGISSILDPLSLLKCGLSNFENKCSEFVSAVQNRDEENTALQSLNMSTATIIRKLSETEESILQNFNAENYKSPMTEKVCSLLEPISNMKVRLEAIQNTALNKNQVEALEKAFEGLVIPLKHLTINLRNVEKQVAINYASTDDTNPFVKSVAQTIILFDQSIHYLHEAASTEPNIHKLSTILNEPMTNAKNTYINIFENIFQQDTFVFPPSKLQENFEFLTVSLEKLQVALKKSKQHFGNRLKDRSGMCSPDIAVAKILVCEIQILCEGVSQVQEESCALLVQNNTKEISNKFSTLHPSLKSFHAALEIMKKLGSEIEKLTGLFKIKHLIHNSDKMLEKLGAASLHDPKLKQLSSFSELSMPIKSLETELLKIQSCIAQDETLVRTHTNNLEVIEELITPIADFVDSLNLIQRKAQQPQAEDKVLKITTSEVIKDAIKLIENKLEVVTSQLCSSHNDSEESSLLKMLRVVNLHANTLCEILSHIEKEYSVNIGDLEVTENKNLLVIQGALRSVEELRNRIESTNTIAKMPHESVIPEEILKSISEPLLELQQSLIQVEQQVLGSGIKSGSTAANIYLISSLTQPFQELLEILEKDEQQSSELTTFSSLEGKVKKMDRCIQPVQELRQAIFLIQKTVSGTSGRLSPESIAMESLLHPLEILQHELDEIERYIVDPVLVVKTSQKVFDSFQNSLHKLEQGFQVIETQAFLGPDEQPLSERESLSILEDLAVPLNDLFQCLIMIDHDMQGQSISQKLGVGLLKSLTGSVSELRKGISLVKKQTALEPASDPLSEYVLELVENLAQPMQDLRKELTGIQYMVHFEALNEENENNFTPNTKQFEDMQEIMPMRPDKTAITSLDEDSLKKVASCIQSLKNIHIDMEKRLKKERNNPLLQTTGKNILTTIGAATEDLCKSLEELEQKGNTQKDIASVFMKNMSAPLQLLMECTEQIQELATSETSQSIRTFLTALLAATEKPITELQKVFGGSDSVNSETVRLLIGGKESHFSETGDENVNASNKVSPTLTPLKYLGTCEAPVLKLQEVCEAIKKFVFEQRRGDEVHPVFKLLIPPIKQFQLLLTQLQSAVASLPENIGSDHNKNIEPNTLQGAINELSKNVHFLDKEIGREPSLPTLSEQEHLLVEKFLISVQEIQNYFLQKDDKTDCQSYHDTVSPETRLLENIAQRNETALPVQCPLTKQSELEEAPISITEHLQASVCQILSVPLKKLRNSIAQIQQQICLNNNDRLTEDIINILKTIEKPLEEIQKFVTFIEENKEDSNKSDFLCSIKSLAEKGIQLMSLTLDIEDNILVVGECNVQKIEPNVTLNIRMAEHVEEIDHLLSFVENYTDISEKERDTHKESACSSTSTASVQGDERQACLTAPNISREPKNEQKLTENKMHYFPYMVQSLLELKEIIPLVEKLVLENSTESLFENELMQAIKGIDVLCTDLQKCTSPVETCILTGSEIPKESVSDLKLKVNEIKHAIHIMNEKIHNEKTLPFLNKETNRGIIQTFSQKIEIVQNSLMLFSEAVSVDHLEKSVFIEQSTNDKVPYTPESVNILSSAMQASGVASVNREIATQSAIVSLLDEITKPLENIKKSLAQTHENILSAKVNQACELDIAQIKVGLAVPVVELNKLVALIEGAEVYEDVQESSPDQTKKLVFEEIAGTICALKQALSHLEHTPDKALENFERDSIINKTVLVGLEKPVKELQDCVALLEEKVQSISSCEDLQAIQESRVLEMTAEPLIVEVVEDIDGVENQIIKTESDQVMKGYEEKPRLIEKPTSDKISDIPETAKELYTSTEGLGAANEITEFSVQPTAVALLDEITQPLENIKKSLAQAQENILSGESNLSHELDVAQIKAELAVPITELKKVVALIERSEIYEVVQEGTPDQRNTLVFTELAKPVCALKEALSQLESIPVETLQNLNSENLVDKSVLVNLENPIKQLQECVSLLEEKTLLLSSCGDLQAMQESCLPKMSANALVHVVEDKHGVENQIVKTVSGEVLQGYEEKLGLIEETVSDKISDIPETAKELYTSTEGLGAANEITEFSVQPTAVALLDEITQPLENIKKSLAQAQENILSGESNLAHELDVAQINVGLAVPVLELKKLVALIERAEVYEYLQESSPDKTIKLVFAELAEPICALKEAISQLEHIPVETLGNINSDKLVEKSVVVSLENPVKHLQECVALLEEKTHLLSSCADLQKTQEPHQSGISAKSLVHNDGLHEAQMQIVKSVKDVNEDMFQVFEEKQGLKEESASVKTSNIPEIAKELHASVEVSGAESESNKFSAQLQAISLLDEITQPLENIKKSLAQAQKNILSGEANLAHELDIAQIKAGLAVPIVELKKVVALIEKAEVYEDVQDSTPGQTKNLTFAELAEPMCALKEVLYQLEHIPVETLENINSDKLVEKSEFISLENPIKQLQECVAILGENAHSLESCEDLKAVQEMCHSEISADLVAHIVENLHKAEKNIMESAKMLPEEEIRKLSTPIQDVTKCLQNLDKIIFHKDAMIHPEPKPVFLQEIYSLIQKLHNGIALVEKSLSSSLMDEGEQHLGILVTRQLERQLNNIEKRIIYLAKEGIIKYSTEVATDIKAMDSNILQSLNATGHTFDEYEQEKEKYAVDKAASLQSSCLDSGNRVLANPEQIKTLSIEIETIILDENVKELQIIHGRSDDDKPIDSKATQSVNDAIKDTQLLTIDELKEAQILSIGSGVSEEAGHKSTDKEVLINDKEKPTKIKDLVTPTTESPKYDVVNDVVRDVSTENEITETKYEVEKMIKDENNVEINNFGQNINNTHENDKDQNRITDNKGVFKGAPELFEVTDKEQDSNIENNLSKSLVETVIKTQRGEETFESCREHENHDDRGAILQDSQSNKVVESSRTDDNIENKKSTYFAEDVTKQPEITQIIGDRKEQENYSKVSDKRTVSEGATKIIEMPNLKGSDSEQGSNTEIFELEDSVKEKTERQLDKQLADSITEQEKTNENVESKCKTEELNKMLPDDLSVKIPEHKNINNINNVEDTISARSKDSLATSMKERGYKYDQLEENKDDITNEATNSKSNVTEMLERENKEGKSKKECELDGVSISIKEESNFIIPVKSNIVESVKKETIVSKQITKDLNNLKEAEVLNKTTNAEIELTSDGCSRNQQYLPVNENPLQENNENVVCESRNADVARDTKDKNKDSREDNSNYKLNNFGEPCNITDEYEATEELQPVLQMKQEKESEFESNIIREDKRVVDGEEKIKSTGAEKATKFEENKNNEYVETKMNENISFETLKTKKENQTGTESTDVSCSESKEHTTENKTASAQEIDNVCIKQNEKEASSSFNTKQNSKMLETQSLKEKESRGEASDEDKEKPTAVETTSSEEKNQPSNITKNDFNKRLQSDQCNTTDTLNVVKTKPKTRKKSKKSPDKNTQLQTDMKENAVQDLLAKSTERDTTEHAEQRIIQAQEGKTSEELTTSHGAVNEQKITEDTVKVNKVDKKSKQKNAAEESIKGSHQATKNEETAEEENVAKLLEERSGESKANSENVVATIGDEGYSDVSKIVRKDQELDTRKTEEENEEKETLRETELQEKEKHEHRQNKTVEGKTTDLEPKSEVNDQDIPIEGPKHKEKTVNVKGKIEKKVKYKGNSKKIQHKQTEKDKLSKDTGVCSDEGKDFDGTEYHKDKAIEKSEIAESARMSNAININEKKQSPECEELHDTAINESEVLDKNSKVIKDVQDSEMQHTLEKGMKDFDGKLKSTAEEENIDKNIISSEANLTQDSDGISKESTISNKDKDKTSKEETEINSRRKSGEAKSDEIVTTEKAIQSKEEKDVRNKTDKIEKQAANKPDECVVKDNEYSAINGKSNDSVMFDKQKERADSECPQKDSNKKEDVTVAKISKEEDKLQKSGKKVGHTKNKDKESVNKSEQVVNIKKDVKDGKRISPSKKEISNSHKDDQGKAEGSNISSPAEENDGKVTAGKECKNKEDTKRILKDNTEHKNEAETKHRVNEEITGSAERVGDKIQPQKSEDIFNPEKELTTESQLERKEEIKNMCNSTAGKSTEAKEEKLGEATVGATEAKTDISEDTKKKKSTRKEKKSNSVKVLSESKDTTEQIVSNNNLSEGENNSKVNNDVYEAKIIADITNISAEKRRDSNVFIEQDRSPSADAAYERAKSCEMYGATVNGYSVKEMMGDDSTERSSTLTESITSSTLTPGHTTRSIPDRINAAEDTSLASMEDLPFDKPSRYRVRDANKGGRGEKPRFSTRLADRTAAQGSRIKLTASVLGSPEPAISWLKDGLPLSDPAAWRATCSGGLATLELPSASPSQSGEYTCVARNTHGQTSSSAELRVCAGFEPAPFPPTFTRLIKDSYRWSEDQLVLECRVRSQPPPKVTWLKGGAPLAADGRYQQEELPGGVCRLVIGSPHSDVDSGRYTCRAENLLWSDSVSADVDFPGREQLSRYRRSEVTGVSTVSRDHRRPQFTSILTDHVVPSGGTMALQVHVKGVPRPEVTWLKGSEPLRADESARLRVIEESGLHTLLVSGVTESEAGVYTCRAANMYGHTLTTAAVEVVPSGGTVRGGRPAQFLSRPDQDMHVAVGEDIVVSFRVGGDPRPKVTWMKGIRDLSNSQRSLKETVNDYVRLTLKRALLSDAGTYCIMAKNVYGCDRAFFTVRIRQRARSLTPVARWGNAETSTILRDIHDQMERDRRKDVPAAVCGQPAVLDSGRNWLTLNWPKSEPRAGVPVLAYRVEAWQLGEDGGARWTELGVTPINSFDAFNLKAGQQYQFRVTPRNRYGWGEPVTTTTPVLVGGCDQLPEFERILPGQLKALRGSSVTLTCQVRGSPEPEVRWCKDGWQVYEDACPRISSAVEGGQCRLAISDVQDEDEGRYMCEATNRAGRASTFARLVVVADPRIMQADADLKRGILDDDDADRELPPQFTMRLRDRRVQMTYPVRLTCQVMGNPQPEVTWSKDGQVIQPGDTHAMLSEQQFHTLELSRATLEDGGQYSATARNSLGAVSCRCRLVVDKGIRAYVGPEFLCDLPPELLLHEGDQVHLAAHVEAYPIVGVMWYRDGVRLRPSRRAVMTLDHDGRVELTLAGVTAKDAGVYSCTATNEVGRAETSCRVRLQDTDEPHQPTHPPPPRVLAPDTPHSDLPLFLTKPRSTEAVEGDTVIILCEVVGDPKPEVIWLRDWLKPDYYRDAPHFRRVGDGPEYRLEIPLARLDYTGAYSVIARNCHGEAKAVISLQIYAKGQGKEEKMDHSSIKHGRVQTLPVVRRGLKDLRCCDGDAVTLECRVQATPAPDVRWEKGGRLLPLGGDIVAEFDGETARLTIQQVYPEDEGEYTCVVYNELGKASTSACLVVDVPEEKDTLLSQRLARPPGLMSAGSTPRSTPRSTPSRSKSPSISRPRERNTTPSGGVGEGRQRRLRLAAPKFYAVPHNRVAEEGETVRLQCAVAGHPAPWTSWDKDGQTVTPSARLTLAEKDDLRVLQIDEVTPEDAGLYRVTLENEVGRVEASARLEVIGRHGVTSRGLRAWSASPRSSPSYSRRLAPSTARVGGRLTLACDLRGSPSPVTSWYRGGELVVRSARATPSWDGRTARLELECLEPEDAGVYTCSAENEAGRARCSAELKVLASDDPSDEDRRPPVFPRGLPDHVHLTEGEPAELQVLLRGTPAMDVVWTKDGVEVPDCNDFRYVDHGEGRLGLRIADVFPEDEGVYRCEAFNDHGDCYTECHVDVRGSSSGGGGVAPQFVKEPLPVLAPVGGRASFCLRAHRVLSPEEVCWRVAGVPASSCSRFKVETRLDESVLTVEPVQAEDAGPVTCDMGDARCRAELGVVDVDQEVNGATPRPESPALLLRGPRDTTALVGDRVVLRAAYSGSPEPTVRWLRAGRELAASERVQLHSQDGVACLSLDNITADDSGKYVVSVENCLGADCHFASVAVEGPPDPPAGRPSVTSCGQGSAVVTWSSPPYDGGCMLTGYSVEMSKASADPQWTVVADKCNSLSHTVVGLQADEKNLFRIRAHNVHGCSDASTESEPFVLGEVEESYGPSFEAREVLLEAGEKFRRLYEVLEELGKGRYGVVHKVCELASGRKFAAKFVRCVKVADRGKVHEEIGIMNMLRHPKLLQLRAAFDTPRDIVMVTEYISGGELFERVVADDFTLTEKDCILFMRQICEGVDYMHQNYVVHLDLKPENIMCHTRTSHQIKLIDFGLAKKLDPDIPVRVMFGTPEFIPPEIINYEPIGLESDMWSVGVICYVLLSGLSPFMGDNDAQTFNNITKADYDFEDEAFDAISQDSKDFISSLLVKRKEKRLTASECLQHKWLTQHHDSMSCVKLSTDKLKTFIIRRKWQLSVARRQKA